MAFKFEGKYVPIFVFAKFCWSIHFKVVMITLRKNAYSKQRKATHTQTLHFQHLCSVFFQHMVWYGPTSETAWMHRRQKNWLQYTDFTELKTITS